MSKIIRSGMILLALILFLGSCSKYDEGPVVSLYSREKRVQGKWYFSNVKYNDVDSTDVYRVDALQSIEFFNNPEKDAYWAAYTWNHGGGQAATSVDYGFWKFNTEMDSIKMITTITLLPGNATRSDTVEYYWKINRLAYTEFWLERWADDTTKITWKLWKIAY